MSVRHLESLTITGIPTRMSIPLLESLTLKKAKIVNTDDYWVYAYLLFGKSWNVLVTKTAEILRKHEFVKPVFIGTYEWAS